MPSFLNLLRRAATAAMCGTLLLATLPAAHGQAIKQLANGGADAPEPKLTTPTPTAIGTPSLTVTYTPAEPVAGQQFTTSWTTNASAYVSFNCISSGGGYEGSGYLGSGSGSFVLTAEAGWVGHPSNCEWIADNGAETKTVYKTLNTLPGATGAKPTLFVRRTPSLMTADSAYTLEWSTDGASLSRVCTASGSGFAANGTMSLSGTQNGQAAAGWVGNPSACTWTATNAYGSTVVNETMTTYAPPTLSVPSRSPSPMVANSPYTLAWSSTNATSVVRVCQSASGGFTSNGQMNLQGPQAGTASTAWIDKPSTCTWTATNAAGAITQQTESMNTIAGAVPTISVSRSPSKMTAGRAYTLSWNTSGATSLTRVCTAGGAGFTSNGAMALEGSEMGTASANWVGNASSCTWTASNANGSAKFVETMTTIAAPTLTLPERMPVTMTAGLGYTLDWSTTNATALTRVCTAAGTGFTSNGAMPLQGPQTGTASSNWVNYPSTCTWTASNSAGATVQQTEIMTTNAGAMPTISVSRSPVTMTAGRAYTLSWNTSNATSLTRVCTAGGAGFTSNGAMALQGPENGTASANWVGNASSCTWTASNANGSAQFVETMNTIAEPTLTLPARTPATMTAGLGYMLAWSTTNATALTRVCTAAGTGFTFNGAMALQGPETGTASSNWVNYPSNCTWTASNSAGATVQQTEIMNTIAGAMPTISVSRSPVTMTAGRAYTLSWDTSNATSLTRVCTAGGTGFSSNGAMALQGPENGTASANWVGNASSCTWTASNANGSAQFVETMSTVAAPTLTLPARTPATMTVGAGYTLAWSTTNATALTRACTADGTGFTSNGAMALQGPETGTALSNWVNYPSTCTWTASNSAGATVQQTEIMTTNAASVAPTIVLGTRTPSPMTAGLGYSISWSTTNANSLTRVCTSTGTGFTSNGPMNLQGTDSGTARTEWVGYNSRCTWTATGSTGLSATATEDMVTLASAGPGVVYIHTDGLGSPVARTNAAGALVGTTRYEPYGLTQFGSTQTIGFTGHVNDADTGLTYMQQRYYDPVAGRFLSIDPVTTDANTGGSFNRYAYTVNNPYKYIDPDGRNPNGLNAEPYRAPYAEVREAFQSMFGSVDKDNAPISSDMVSKTTVAVTWVEVQRTNGASGGSTYAGLRNTPALAIQTTVEAQSKVGEASGITAKVSASAGAGAVGVTGTASMTVGNGVSAQVSGGGIGLANDKGSFSQKGTVLGVRPPSLGIGITVTDKDAKKIQELVQ